MRTIIAAYSQNRAGVGPTCPARRSIPPKHLVCPLSMGSLEQQALPDAGPETSAHRGMSGRSSSADRRRSDAGWVTEDETSRRLD